MSRAVLDPTKLIRTGTASHRGRSIALSPGNSPLAHLHYGRILLDASVPTAAFDTGDRETGLICMRGACRLSVTTGAGAERAIDVGLHDGVYVPRGSAVRVDVPPNGDVDLVECAADVSGDYPLQIVRYADVVNDPKLRFRAGGAATSRDLNIVLGENVRAGRIVAGFTRSLPGHWTSWPPHEHTDLLEEVYVYFDMPPPAFGIQLVYTQPDQPEFVQVVHEGDAVLMPAGYHPNVAAPGHSINFIWMMAARREVEDRLFGVVNVQPGFDQAGSGLEASRK